MTFLRSNRVCFFRRLTALSLSFFLGITQILPAQGWSAEIRTAPSLTAKSLAQFQLPAHLGTVTFNRSAALRTDSPVFFLIEDAHAIPAAQESIRQIIDHLQTEYDLNTVFFEGSSGRIDPLVFRAFPDPKVLEEVLHIYRDRGELSGVTLAAVLNKNESVYEGVEDKTLYEEQINAWLAGDRMSREVSHYLESLEKELIEAEARYSSKALQALNHAGRQFQKDHDFALWLRALEHAAREAGLSGLEERYPSLTVLFKELEKNETETQRPEMREALGRLYAQVFRKAAADEKKQLSERQQAYLTEKLNAGAWAGELVSAARRQKASVQLPAAVEKAARHHETLQALQGREVFTETETLAREIRQSLCVSAEEQAIDSLRERLDLLKHLARLELSRPEWQKMEGRSASAMPETLSGLDRRVSEFEKELLDTQSAFMQFYSLAQAREDRFWKKIHSSIAARPAPVFAFVGGGFHTAGLEAHLRQSQMSYVVITPAMSTVASPEEAYRSTMRGNVSWAAGFDSDSSFLEPYKAFTREAARELRGRIHDAQLKLWQRSIHEETVRQGQTAALPLYLELISGTTGLVVPESFMQRWHQRVEDFIGELNQSRQMPVFQAMTATAPFANPLVRNVRYPAEWRGGVPAKAALRSEVRKKTWLEVSNLERVKERTVISRQMEAGLHEGILQALRQLPDGENIARKVAQTTLTGGLGALMHDLFDAWGKNGIDVIGINPIYEKIKAQEFVTGTTPDVEFGKYLRQVLQPAGIEDFPITLDISEDFVNEARRRGSRAMRILDGVENGKAIVKELIVRTYETTTVVAGTKLYYQDVLYRDGDKEVSIFDEVYPDEKHQVASLWRDIHIAAYNKASMGLVQRLEEQGRIKKKKIQVNNEVFVSLPTGEDRHDINHTVFLPGLYRSNALSYSMFDLPEEWYGKVVRNGVIDLTNVIPLDPKLRVITGVGLKEHTPELEKNIFPGFLELLDGFNELDIRSTNGVLFDKWQVPLKRTLIQQFKDKLGMSEPEIGDDTEDDRLFFEKLNGQPELLEEFKRKSEYINAGSVAAFLLWLKNEQGQARWFEQTLAQGLNQPVVSAELSVPVFQKEIQSIIENNLSLEELDEQWGAMRDALMARPMVSNIRRQVPYKGPDKWLEILRGFTRDGLALANFKKNGVRAVIGGRVFDPGAQGTFNEIKRLIVELGLEDQMTTIENYNNLDAEVIFQAMAGMVMLSDEFLEASATSMMKGQANFSALIGVWGGAMPEIFEIVDVETGSVIDIFDDTVTHDEVLQNLNSGAWKIINGWMVSYNDERSEQDGGGRRPDAQSLVKALLLLQEVYRNPALRRDLQQHVIASSWRVNMVTSQARAHAQVWERALKRAEDEAAFMDGLNETDDDFLQLLSVNDGGFQWKTGDQSVVVQSESGLIGFLKGFEELRFMERDKVKTVYPALVYHLTHVLAGREGDVFHYILGHLFKETPPSLLPLKRRIEGFQKAAAATDRLNQKLRYNLEAIGLLSRLVEKRQAFLHSEGFTAQIIRRYISGEAKLSRVFANTSVLTETIEYLTSQAPASELENFFEAAVHNMAQGDHFVAHVFRDKALRQKLSVYLKGKTGEETLDFSSSKVPVYPVGPADKAVFLAIDLGDFIYSPQRGGEQKAWTNVRNSAFYLRKHHPADQTITGKSRYQVRDVLTGALYADYDLQTMQDKGLPVGVPVNFIQVVAVESAPEERLPVLIANAVRGQLTYGNESSTLIAEELVKLSTSPQRLRAVLSSIAALTPEAAREKFVDAETQSNGIPAVMALIGFFAPDLLSKTQAWDADVYQKLNAVYNRSGLDEILSRGKVQLHKADPDTAIVISKTLGRRKLILPIQFSKFRYSEDDGKVWVRVSSEDVGILDDTSVFYNVRDYSIGSVGTEYGVHSGRELSLDDWHVGIPVVPGKLDRKGVQQHGWQFQILELEQLQTSRDDHDRRIDALVGGALNLPQVQGETFYINLTDLGAVERDGKLVFENGLKRAEELLDVLRKLGISEVYLGGGLYPASEISVPLHQVPNAQEHFIPGGKATIRVIDYNTQKAAIGEWTLAHDQGNPYSVGGPQGMLRINPKLAAGEDAREALIRVVEKAHRYGIRIRADFISWRSPDAIDASNYRQTFYREMTADEKRIYDSKTGPSEKDNYLRSIISRDGTLFYTHITEDGQERVIFVKHVWGYGGANADQAMINVLAPEAQDYLIAALKQRIDEGIDSLRVDLAFQLLKRHAEHYLNGLSHETVVRWAQAVRSDEEPLVRIIREVRAYAAEKGRTLTLNAEAYEEDDRRLLLELGFDSTYYASPFEDYANLVFEQAPAYHLAGSIGYALKYAGEVTVYASNFDQTSLRRIGGPRKGFTMLLNLLAYLGVDVLWTLREALGHYGDVAPIPGGASRGPKDRHHHEFVSLRELQVRTNPDRIEQELTQGPLARSLAEITGFFPAPVALNDRKQEDVQILDNQNTQQFISFAYRNEEGGWTVFIYNTKPETPVEIWVRQPDAVSGESRRGYRAQDVYSTQKAAEISENRLTDIRFERGDQYRVLTFGPARSEVRLTPERQALNEAVAPYLDELSRGDDFSRQAPDVFLLLGNPNLRVFLEFAQRWKTQYAGTPIVLAGGRGRGTVPLIQAVLAHYGDQLSAGEREMLNRGLTDNAVKEADVLRLVLNKEGIDGPIRFETQPSSNTAQNFQFSAPVIKELVGDEPQPVVAVVSAPWLLKRIQVTAESEFSKLGFAAWQTKRFQAFQLDLEQLADQELVDLLTYIAGYPDTYVDRHPNLPRWNERSELNGFYGVQGVPDVDRDFSQVITVQDAFKPFLDAHTVQYDLQFNRLVLLRSEIRRAVRVSVDALVNGQTVPAETTEFLAGLAAAELDQAIEAIRDEAEKPEVVLSAYERTLAAASEPVQTAASAERAEFDGLTSEFTAGTIEAVRAAVHDALQADKTRSFNFAMAFPASTDSKISQHILDYARMLQSLQAEYPVRVTASLLLLADAADVSNQGRQDYFKALSRTGVVKTVTASDAQFAVKTQRFLRDNPNALVWGAFEDALQPAQRIHLVITPPQIGLRTALPFAFLLSRKLAEARALSAELLRKVPESLPGGAVAYNGSTLEVTRFAAALVSQIKARQLLEMAA